MLKTSLGTPDGKYIVEALIADKPNLTLRAASKLFSQYSWIDDRDVLPAPGTILEEVWLEVKESLDTGVSAGQELANWTYDLQAYGQLDVGKSITDSVQYLEQIAATCLSETNLEAEFAMGEKESGLGEGPQEAVLRLVCPKVGVDRLGTGTEISRFVGYIAKCPEILKYLDDPRAMYPYLSDLLVHDDPRGFGRRLLEDAYAPDYVLGALNSPAGIDAFLEVASDQAKEDPNGFVRMIKRVTAAESIVVFAEAPFTVGGAWLLDRIEQSLKSGQDRLSAGLIVVARRIRALVDPTGILSPSVALSEPPSWLHRLLYGSANDLAVPGRILEQLVEVDGTDAWRSELVRTLIADDKSASSIVNRFDDKEITALVAQLIREHGDVAERVLLSLSDVQKLKRCLLRLSDPELARACLKARPDLATAVTAGGLRPGEGFSWLFGDLPPVEGLLEAGARAEDQLRRLLSDVTRRNRWSRRKLRRLLETWK